VLMRTVLARRRAKKRVTTLDRSIERRHD